MEELSKEFVKNRYGIIVVKCCASCKHREAIAGDNVRRCRRGFGKHKNNYLCGSGWEMDDSLDNAGKGGGRVKKKSYFDFVNKYGFHHAEDYERQYGSKYLTKR